MHVAPRCMWHPISQKARYQSEGNLGFTNRTRISDLRTEAKRIWACVVNESETVVDQAFLETLARDPDRTYHVDDARS